MQTLHIFSQICCRERLIQWCTVTKVWHWEVCSSGCDLHAWYLWVIPFQSLRKDLSCSSACPAPSRCATALHKKTGEVTCSKQVLIYNGWLHPDLQYFYNQVNTYSDKQYYSSIDAPPARALCGGQVFTPHVRYLLLCPSLAPKLSSYLTDPSSRLLTPLEAPSLPCRWLLPSVLQSEGLPSGSTSTRCCFSYPSLPNFQAINFLKTCCLCLYDTKITRFPQVSRKLFSVSLLILMN